MATDGQRAGLTALYNAVRTAVEPYEDAVLTTDRADALASDVLAILEEQA